MSLANMITASSVRKQELLERPALQLREQKAFRSSEALKEETIKTSAQNRLLAGKEEERDVKEEARTAELHPGNVEQQKYQVGTAAYNEQSAKLKVFKERQDASEGAPQETVNQAMATWKIWQETGNPEARKQTYNIMNGLAGSPEMQGLLAYNIPYGDLSSITSEMLSDPNDPTGENTDKMLGLAFMNAEMNMAAYQASLKEKAQRTAAELLAMTSAQAEGEAYGEGIGEARARTDIAKQGLVEEPVKVNATEQRSAQENTGRDVIRSMNATGIGKDKMAKLGITPAAFADMDPEVYAGEKMIFDVVKDSYLKGPSTINMGKVQIPVDFSSKAAARTSMTDIYAAREEIKELTGVDLFASDSPFNVALSEAVRKYSDGWGWGRKSDTQQIKKSPAFRGIASEG